MFEFKYIWKINFLFEKNHFWYYSWPCTGYSAWHQTTPLQKAGFPINVCSILLSVDLTSFHLSKVSYLWVWEPELGI